MRGPLRTAGNVFGVAVASLLVAALLVYGPMLAGGLPPWALLWKWALLVFAVYAALVYGAIGSRIPQGTAIAIVAAPVMFVILAAASAGYRTEGAGRLAVLASALATGILVGARLPQPRRVPVVWGLPPAPPKR